VRDDDISVHSAELVLAGKDHVELSGAFRSGDVQLPDLGKHEEAGVNTRNVVKREGYPKDGTGNLRESSSSSNATSSMADSK
jgi:hypothetical protein